METPRHIDESDYLARQLEEVLLHGTWIANTNFKEVMSGLTLSEATHRSQGKNSIAMLVYHINYYMAGVLNVLQGGTLNIRDRYSFDMPDLHTEADWEALQHTFLDNAKTFITAVRNMPQEVWPRTFVKSEYGTYRRNIDGFIAHSYYHLGQMVLLKKNTL